MLLYINNLILFVLCVFWLNKNVVYYYLYIFYFYFDIVICDFSNCWFYFYFLKYFIVLVYLCFYIFENYCDCFVVDSDIGEKFKDR